MSNQEKYYTVIFENGKNGYIKTSKTLRCGRIYTLKNGNHIRVLNKTTFKYSIDDIITIKNIMEQYDIGTLQYNLAVKLSKIIENGIPSVRFNKDEKELLWDIYNYDDNLSDNDIKVISKILNIN